MESSMQSLNIYFFLAIYKNSWNYSYEIYINSFSTWVNAG